MNLKRLLRRLIGFVLLVTLLSGCYPLQSSISEGSPASEETFEANQNDKTDGTLEISFVSPEIFPNDYLVDGLGTNPAQLIKTTSNVNLIEFTFSYDKNGAPVSETVLFDNAKMIPIYQVSKYIDNKIWTQICAGTATLHASLLNTQVFEHIGFLESQDSNLFIPVGVRDWVLRDWADSENVEHTQTCTRIDRHSFLFLQDISLEKLLEQYYEQINEECQSTLNLKCIAVALNGWSFNTTAFLFYNDEQEFLVSPDGFHYTQDFMEAAYLLPDEHREFMLVPGKIYNLRTSDLLPFLIEEEKLWEKVFARVKKEVQ